MDSAKVLEALNAKLSDADSFGSRVKFDLEGEGAVIVDGNETPPTAMADDGGEVACTISASADTFEEMLSGDLDPTSAFMTGKLAIDGDMGAAMSVARLLG